VKALQTNTITHSKQLSCLYSEEKIMRKMTFWLVLMAFLALFLVACGGGDDGGGAAGAAEEPAAAEDALAGDATAGEPLFQGTCSACHGPDAKGMPNLGKDMTTSEFIANSSDAELLAFVKVGRSVSDPANTTNVDMPPKGGNPALSDQDLADIIAFIRTLEE
jgi:mono/diheme cytochrome c family protein